MPVGYGFGKPEPMTVDDRHSFEKSGPSFVSGAVFVKAFLSVRASKLAGVLTDRHSSASTTVSAGGARRAAENPSVPK